MEATVQVTQLSMIKRIAIDFLERLKEQIVNGECSDEDIADAMTKFHPSANKEYYNPKDYCNYDEACDVLGIPRTSRAKLHALCKSHNIECVHIKNRPLGFPKKKIEELAKELVNKRKKGCLSL